MNSWNALIICITRLNNTIGEREGRVIDQNFLSVFAPSREAASYKLSGIFFNPARKSNIEEPNCHTVTNPTVKRAQVGLPNQSGPVMPILDKSPLTIPFFINRYFQRTEIATEPPRIDGR